MRAFVPAMVALAIVSTPVFAQEADGVERFHVLVLDLKSDELPAKSVATLSESLTVLVGAKPRIDVTSGAELRAVVDLEGQRQKAGCDDESCLTEVADALGARLVVFGHIGAVGQRLVMTLSLFDTYDAQPSGRAMVETDNVDELFARLPSAIDTLLDPFLESHGVVVRTPLLASALTWGGVSLAVVGVGLAAAGGATAAVFGLRQQELATTVNVYDEAPSVAAAADVATARDQTDLWAGQWNSWGAPLAAVGGGVFVAGVALASSGALYGVVATAEVE